MFSLSRKFAFDCHQGTNYARIEATIIAAAAASSLSSSSSSSADSAASSAPTWEWETWKWDDCDAYRKAIGLGVDKAMEKALLVQRARTVIARIQAFHKQWPAFVRLRDGEPGLPITRQCLHLAALCVVLPIKFFDRILLLLALHTN